MAAVKTPPLELPALGLGLAGFAQAQQDILTEALAHFNSGMRWHVTKLSHADAWCANGSGVSLLEDGSLQIASGAGGTRPLRLDLDQADRPIAFSLPLATGLKTVVTFDPKSQAGIKKVLDRFEGWLRPMTVQFCLASHIAQENLDINTGVYHVSVQGRLLAVVGRGGAGVLPIANPADLVQAVWARRPGFADDIPRHFLRIGFPQLMWQYAMRTTRDVLPVRFRTGLIYWRAPPQLPHRLLNDSHLILARELAHAPVTFRDLGPRTGLSDAQLARNLGALYVVGAITTDRRRAASHSTGAEKARGKQIAAGTSPGEGASTMDSTAPAPFHPDGL